MLYTIRYKLKSQPHNFVKYIIPYGKTKGERADALALWHKLSQVKSVNEEAISEAALCFGGEITYDDGVQGNALVQYYAIWQKMDAEGNIRTVVDDPEPVVAKPIVEEPDEIVGSMEDEVEEIKTIAPKERKKKAVPN